MSATRAEVVRNRDGDWFRGEYSGGQLFFQPFYQLITTSASTNLFSFTFATPFEPLSYGLNYIINGEIIDKALKLTTKDQLYLKQLGAGSVKRGIIRELFGTAMACGVSGAALYGTAYVNSIYMASENPDLQKLGHILADPAIGKPIVGTLAYLLWNTSKLLGMKFWSCCHATHAPRNSKYPDLNLWQIAGGYLLNLGISTSEAVTILYYLPSNNKHVQMALGMSAFLLDKTFNQLFFTVEPFWSTLQKSDRVVTYLENVHDEVGHPGLDQPGSGRVMIGATAKVLYHLILAGLMCALYEFINFADRGTRLHDDDSEVYAGARLAIALGTVLLLDFILRQATPAVTNCALCLFAPPKMNVEPGEPQITDALLEEGRKKRVATLRRTGSSSI